MSDRKIKRALIAVYDKTGIVDFARALVDEFGIEIISTGGTAKHLKDAGIPVTMVEQVTGFPEMLDGRVKTLHPEIDAAILADRDNPDHMRQLAEQGIEPIDMVVVNLYPFEKTVADPNCTFEQAIEMIDIGGPCMLRAAAKNHRHVVTVGSQDSYVEVLRWIANGWLVVSGDDPRLRWAANSFFDVCQYDAQVSEWLSVRLSGATAWPSFSAIFAKNWGGLRYGENPHQKSELWQITPNDSESAEHDLTIADAQFCDSQPVLSHNNFIDADAALGLSTELARASEVIGVWHRFSTGELCDRFPTGRGKKRRVTGEHITERNLPHIQRAGSTYFITFRVRSGELAPKERDLVLSACRFWHGKKMTLHNMVIMPDHVHLLLTPHEMEPGQWVGLSELLHSIKRHSASEINKSRGTSGAFWLDEYFDRVVRHENEFIEKWEYIEANPVTAHIAKPGEYTWYWQSDTEFQETLVGQMENRLETCSTTHRLETGTTTKQPPAATTTIICVCVFIKHTNACGVGIGGDPVEAYRHAYLGDPNAAMGGILACNFEIDTAFAATVMETYDRFGKPLKEKGHPAAPGGFFVEVWLAPSFTDEAIKIVRGTAEPTAELPSPPKKKWGENVRLLAVGDMTAAPDSNEMDFKRIAGGMLVQTRDLLGLNEDQWKVVTKRQPTESEISDLRLAWLIAKHTKSNAISICKDGMLIGNGAGQMSRVMSCRIATWLAKENGHADNLAGSAAASDAFFPFRDGPAILIDAGVTALIQPGGSKRDEEVIAACDERGIAMIFTGTRHFKH